MSTSSNATITPVAGRVLLHIPAPAENAGLLKLPLRKQWRGGCREGIVKALPPRYAGQLAVGDLVLVPAWPDRELVVNGETLIFADEDKLPCVLE